MMCCAAGPLGLGQHVEPALTQLGWAVNVPWSEVGKNVVAITLHGAHVSGSPFSVEATTQVSHSPWACAWHYPTILPCVASCLSQM